MNYLAHAALSPADQQVLIGNLIADHVKGRELSHFPDKISYGIKLHRFIDRSFDTHQHVITLREKCPQGLRRFAGIAIDLWFDHLLAKNWEQLYTVSLSEFQQHICNVLNDHSHFIPGTQTRFMLYLAQEKLFIKYRKKEQVIIQGRMLATRLTKGEKLTECIQHLTNYLPMMESLFIEVYDFMMTHSYNYFNNTFAGVLEDTITDILASPSETSAKIPPKN